ALLITPSKHLPEQCQRLLQLLWVARVAVIPTPRPGGPASFSPLGQSTAHRGHVARHHFRHRSADRQGNEGAGGVILIGHGVRAMMGDWLDMKGEREAARSPWSLGDDRYPPVTFQLPAVEDEACL